MGGGREDRQELSRVSSSAEISPAAGQHSVAERCEGPDQLCDQVQGHSCGRGGQDGEDQAGECGGGSADKPRPQDQTGQVRPSPSSKIQDTDIAHYDGRSSGEGGFGWFVGGRHSHDGAGGKHQQRLKTGAVLLADHQLGEHQQQVRKSLRRQGIVPQLLMVLLTVGLQAFLRDPVQDLQWLSTEAYKVDFAEESARAVSQQPVALYALPGANEAVSQSAADLSGNTKQLPRRVRRTILAYYKKNFSGQSRDKAGQQQSDVDLMEIYSPPRVTARARRFGLKHGGALDLATGWDFTLASHRDAALRLVRELKPALIILSPPCRTFSSLRYLSDHKRSRDVVEREKKGGLEHLRFAVQLAKLQMKEHRGFLCLQTAGNQSPWRSSWSSREFSSQVGCVFLDWSPRPDASPQAHHATHQHRDSCYPLRSSM